MNVRRSPTGQQRRRPCIRAEIVDHLAVVHRHVMRMHMVAGDDVLRRIADDLAVFQDRLAIPDRPQANLVSAWDIDA